MSYFNKLPVIEYGDQNCKNILSRAVLTAKSLTQLNTYQSYNVPEGVRASELAFDYYGSTNYDWMLYISNNIVDPYYQWPLDTLSLDEYIINKYGSIEYSQQGIKHYRVNYRSNQQDILTPAAYDALATIQKNYWTIGDIDKYGEPVSYKRKQLPDNVLRTNKTMRINVSSTTGMIINERVIQYSGLSVLGSAQIVKIMSSTSLLVEKIQGTFTNGLQVKTNQSDKTVTLTSSKLLYDCIDPLVITYWEPVSYYDYEQELNQTRSAITAIDSGYLEAVESAFTTILEQSNE